MPFLGFPGGPVVGIPLAMQGHRLDPWPRKIPHAAEQLSPRTATTAPSRPSTRALQQKPLQREARTLHPDSSSHSATRESP